MDSCNEALRAFGYKERTLEEVRQFVGNGLGVLAELALPDGKSNPDYNKVLQKMRDAYAKNWRNKTKPYDGVQEMLATLRAHHEIKPGVWSVQIGSLKMNFPKAQLIPVPAKKHPTAATIIVEQDQPSSGSESDKPQFELRLLGMRYEEAMKALEHQLDLCAVHNFRNFSIIHGKGSGILQQAVHDYLSHYPGVKEFHFAQPEEGGTGKTYVTLY